MNTGKNVFYLFIPISVSESLPFDAVTRQMDCNPFWSLQPNDTKYFFRYISDKFDYTEKAKCQCLTYQLSEDGMNQLKLDPEQWWEIHRPIGNDQTECYRFQIKGLTLYRFRTEICIAAFELTAAESEPMYLSTLQFWLKSAQTHKIYPVTPDVAESAGLTLLDLVQQSVSGIFDFPTTADPFFYVNKGKGRANMLTFLSVDPNESEQPLDVQKSLYYLRGLYSHEYEYHRDPVADQEESFCCVEHINWGITTEAAVCLAELTDSNTSFLHGAFFRNFRQEYRFMYVLLLHQKYVLYRFLTKIGIGMHNDLEILEAYRAELYEFETNFMFYRITEVPQYQKLYAKISQTFALKELYDDVDEPVNELGEQQRSKRDSVLNSSLVILSLLACVSAMTDGFAFIDAYLAVSPTVAFGAKLVCSAFVVLAFLLVLFSLLAGKPKNAMRKLKQFFHRHRRERK